MAMLDLGCRHQCKLQQMRSAVFEIESWDRSACLEEEEVLDNRTHQSRTLYSNCWRPWHAESLNSPSGLNSRLNVANSRRLYWPNSQRLVAYIVPSEKNCMLLVIMLNIISKYPLFYFPSSWYNSHRQTAIHGQNIQYRASIKISIVL